MTHGIFLWADLSTYRPDMTRAFYTGLFGWSCGDYVCSTRGQPVAGIFEMPQTFQRIGMPSFWMSYIGVDDIARTVADATAQGGKVELGPEPFAGGGQIALIRDPLGAGFTVYQGPALSGAAQGEIGTRIGHGLFVSDMRAVIPFYQSLFGWDFDTLGPGFYAVRAAGKTIFHAHEIPDPAVRGKEQYWAVLFAVADINAARAQVMATGGAEIAAVDLPEGPAALMQDPDGAAFFILDKKHAVTPRRVIWKIGGIVAVVAILVILALAGALP